MLSGNWLARLQLRLLPPTVRSICDRYMISYINYLYGSVVDCSVLVVNCVVLVVNCVVLVVNLLLCC